MTRRLILHVLESYGAGSARAAEGYAARLPEFDHVVLRHVRPGESVAGQERAAFSKVYELPTSPFAAIGAIRRVVREIRPHRIHAHSSFAGAWVRLALPKRIARRAVVYTPHCFAFEREDLRPSVRAAVAVAERLLAPRTSTIAACSMRESELAARLHTRRPAVLVPNTAGTGDGTSDPSMRLLGIGRLGAQKDPELFARIAAQLIRSDSIDDARWAGDGEARPILERSGVEVLGWRAPGEIAQICTEGGVYLHTARWEGFPLAILEAHRFGLPIVARRIPAMAGMPAEWLFDDADSASDLVRSLMDPVVRTANRAAWQLALAGNTEAAQRAALLRAYDIPEVVGR